MQDLLNGLKQKLEQNQQKASNLRATIETLWERLSIDEEVRELFLMENRGAVPSTIQVVCYFRACHFFHNDLFNFVYSQLERELSRLEELKRQNIERFIVAVREDLNGWWDRCYVSENERRDFVPFYAEAYTEELLELHEMEVEKYKKIHIDCKDILFKVWISFLIKAN